jgi:hypothetical protein
MGHFSRAELVHFSRASKVDAGSQTPQGSASRHGLDLDVYLRHSLDRQVNALAFAQFGTAHRL